MAGSKFDRSDQDILILDENQLVDDSIFSSHISPLQPTHRPPSDDGGSLCETLKLAREARGLDIRTVASALKIKPEQVESLEAGSVDAFPKFYALGFLRTYAAYLGEEALGFSAKEAVARFKEEREHFKKAQSLSFPVAITEARLPEAPVLLGSAVLAALIYSAWFMLAGAPIDGSDRVPGVPASLVAEAGSFEPFVEDVASIAPDLSEPAGVESKQEAGLAPVESVQKLAEKSEVPIEVAPRTLDVPEVAEPEEPLSPIAAASVSEPRVLVRANRDAWVRIDGAGDATILNGVIHAGDHVAAPDHGEIKITTANAGALELVVDGESVGQMGEDGQIHQNLSVDIDQLLGQSVRTN